MSEVAVTTSWNGLQVVTSPLTDLLLWIEDRLDNEHATFIQCMGVSELNSILQGNTLEIDAHAVLINSAFLGNVISLSGNAAVKAVDVPYFSTILMDMALDNRCKMAKVSPEGKVESLSGHRSNCHWQELFTNAGSIDELQQRLIESRAELVVSEWDASESPRLFEEISRIRRGMVWLQLPQGTATSEDVSVVLKKKVQEAKLAYQLLVMRSLLSSKSK